MTETTPSAVPELRMVRTIDASVTEVFAAWTDPALLRRWLAPYPYEVLEAAADARPGGSYRISVVGPEGDVHVTTGSTRRSFRTGGS